MVPYVREFEWRHECSSLLGAAWPLLDRKLVQRASGNGKLRGVPPILGDA
jgi:hypothetical protein